MAPGSAASSCTHGRIQEVAARNAPRTTPGLWIQSKKLNLSMFQAQGPLLFTFFTLSRLIGTDSNSKLKFPALSSDSVLSKLVCSSLRGLHINIGSEPRFILRLLFSGLNYGVSTCSRRSFFVERSTRDQRWAQDAGNTFNPPSSTNEGRGSRVRHVASRRRGGNNDR